MAELRPIGGDAGTGALRAGDAVQLASCLQLQDSLEGPLVLVAFDERLLAAARKERVAVA